MDLSLKEASFQISDSKQSRSEPCLLRGTDFDSLVSAGSRVPVRVSRNHEAIFAPFIIDKSSFGGEQIARNIRANPLHRRILSAKPCGWAASHPDEFIRPVNAMTSAP